MRKQLICLACAVLLAGCGNDANTLRMATEATFPPYEFLRGQEIVGVDVEVCRAIAARLGRQLGILNVDFDAVIAAVVSGRADLAAAGLTITEDRRNSVDFSIPYLTTGLVIIHRKSDSFTTGEACKGRRVGVQSGTTSDEYVVRTLGQEPERFRSTPEAVVALQSGRCDLVLCDQILARHCVLAASDLTISDRITTEEYAIAVQKGRSDLLKAVNEALVEMKADGRLDRWVDTYVEEAEKTNK